MTTRLAPIVVDAIDHDRLARFWELLGFQIAIEDSHEVEIAGSVSDGLIPRSFA